MLKKLMIGAGFGAGYVLGAKAGRERYQQIVDQFNAVMGKPAVREATDTIKQSASEIADTAKATATEKIDTATTAAKDAVSSGSGGSGGSDPYPSPTAPGAAASLSAPDTSV